jgi:hypothetical protein
MRTECSFTLVESVVDEFSPSLALGLTILLTIDTIYMYSM